MSPLAWIAQSGVVQGVIMGAALALLAVILILNSVGRSITTITSGWRSIRRAGQPGNGVLVRAAAQKALPVVNVFEEAAYWTTTQDADGHRLLGSNRYVLKFPADGLPPADAFWSLTVTDRVGYMVHNSIGRSSFNDRSPLARGEDGSTQIQLQREAPPDGDQNWLPTTPGGFKLMLRAYLPGKAILDGSYRVPGIERVS
jgi:hypothetical protein